MTVETRGSELVTRCDYRPDNQGAGRARRRVAAVLVNAVHNPAAAVALSERLSDSRYPSDNDTRAAPPALLILHGADDECASRIRGEGYHRTELVRIGEEETWNSKATRRHARRAGHEARDASIDRWT